MNPLWQPNQSFIDNSNLQKYLNWLEEKQGLQFSDYQSLWRWSVDNIEDFWESIWNYFDIISHSPYKQVLSNHDMPGAKWFEGSTLNYAEHIFRSKTDKHPAIIFQSEKQPLMEISWEELYQEVASMVAYLKSLGVKKGDRVVAFLPNIPEASIAFLASCSIGAIWSSCSPDFGVNSVVDRFAQIEPKVLFTVDGYQYNSKPYDKTQLVKELCDSLPTLEKVIAIPYLDRASDFKTIQNSILWQETLNENPPKIHFEPVPFDHPIWVLYSSGTTGIPKAITHSHGGNLLEHYKYVAFHNDVHPGERFFWFSTTGWMMWNYLHATALMGATLVLFDGSPGYPDLNVLWELTEKVKINHFGTSAPFLVANMKRDMEPGKDFNLEHLRSIGSTGSPLPPEAYGYVYDKIKNDVWLCSMSGGTDVCTAWVGGCTMLPVYEGEIQSRSLGAPLFAFNEMQEAVEEQVGELVVTKPMPSMPVFFWNDAGMKRYKASYFEMFQGIWRHGDWIKITERGSVIIYGRSDATLNRKGVRIGTAEIYRAMNQVAELKDSLIVNIELDGGDDYMPLFVMLNEGCELNEDLQKKIKTTLRSEYTPRHVPDDIIVVEDIPYTISGKKLEAPIKKILMGVPVEKAANKDAMKNPESLAFFVEWYERSKNPGTK